MNSHGIHTHLNGGKSLTLGNHKPMYSSASAASSGSSSGHRSNHTQHSIVSVHGNQQPPSSVVTTSGLPYDQYRPMISTFGGGHPHHHSMQEQSPSQIYNEPTGPTSYYATGALPDRPGTGNGGGSSGGSSGSANGNSGSNTFFSPPNSAAARFNHNTMRASLTAHHRLTYEQQQQQQQGSSGVMTSVSVNPKF